MNPKDVLLESLALIAERGVDYGNGLEDNFSRIAEMFELSTGVKIEPYQAALFLVCLKLARIRQSPTKADNYLDLINYTAFALSLVSANDPSTSNDAVEE